MKHYYFIILSIASIAFLSCEKIVYFDDRYAIEDVYSRALVHSASGDEVFAGQTIEAVAFGFSCLDGVEVDIQLSKDNTLWLNHDSKVYDAYNNNLGSFSIITDEIIQNIYNYDSTYYYSTLDTVFYLMSRKYPEKFISLDVKRPTKILTYNSYNIIASEIINLIQKYNLQGHVLVESSSNYFLKKLNNPEFGIQTYYFCLGDFDKGVTEAISDGFTGISFKINSYDELNEQLINLLHSSGLKIQAFYANEPKDIINMLSFGVDYLQTDNLDFYTIVESQ